MKKQISNQALEVIPSKPANFSMIDVGRKRSTRRRAVACGSIYMNQEAFSAIENDTLPKGNVLALAEAAGIMGAKRTPDLIPLCHTLPLDQAKVNCVLNAGNLSVTVYAQAAAYAKTGVEMEALAAVNAALLTIWDLTKGIDAALSISDVRLLSKTGGKSGVWQHPQGVPDWLAEQLADPQVLKGKTAAILVMSDRASSGDYTDQSGPVLKEALCEAGASLAVTEVIPDEKAQIAATLQAICKTHRPDLLIASGGTGPGPRDVTPEALAQVSCRMLDGLGDLIRAESLSYTDTAWLSRTTAGMVGATLVVAFPGSPKAVKECWEIISPFIGDALIKIKKQGFESLQG